MSIDLGSAFGTVVLDAQGALDTTDKLGRGLSGLAGPAAAMGGAIVAAGAAAGGALIALGASSVGVAREFESQMAIMSTAVNPLSVGAQTTAEAMDILGDASLAVGSDTELVGVSASTSAEAITGLYKAGLSTSEIFGDLQGYMAGTAELSGALRASIDLAAASELDMVQASDLAAVTLATFGGHLETEAERAEFINSAMNNFVQTADASVASVSDLQAAFVNVGPTASAMGMGVEDVNTALGILSTRGITGSEAGTALKSMLVNLQRTTPDVTETLDELGVSLYNADGTMRALPNIISQLEDSMAGMTEEQRQQTVVTLAGSYGMNAMNTLLGEGVEGWMAMTGAVGEAATMQESAAARTNTLAGAQEALSGVWESFQIKVGTALIPVLTTLADVGATLLEKYGPVMTAVFERIGEALGTVTAIAGEFFSGLLAGESPLDAFGGALESLGLTELYGRFIDLTASLTPLFERIQNLVSPIIDAVTGFVSWKDVLITLGGILTATVLPAIAGVVGGLITFFAPIAAVIGIVALLRNAWEQNWGGIQEKVAGVWAVIQPIFQGIGRAVGVLIENLRGGTDPITSIVMAFSSLGVALGLPMQRILEIGGIIRTFLTDLQSSLTSTWTQLQAGLQVAWGVIQGVIQSAIAVIWPAIQTFIGSLAPVWEQLKGLWPSLMGLWEAAKPVLLGVLSVVGAALVTLVGLASGVLNGLSQALGPLIQGIIGAAQGVIRIFTGVFETLQGLFRLIVGLFTGNTELMQQAWENLKNGVTNIVGGLVDGITSLIGGLVDGVVGFVKGLVEGVIKFFTNLYDRLVGHSIVTDLVEKILSLWRSLWDLTTGVIRAGVDLVRDIFAAFADLFHGDWEAFGEKLFEIWEDAWNLVTDFLGGLWDMVVPWLRSLWQSIQDWFATMDWAELGRNIIEGIVAGLQALGHLITQTIMSFMEAAWERISSFWETGSPSHLTYWLGQMIGQGLINGILSKVADAAEAINALFDAMSSVLNIGSGFGSIFRSDTLDPLQANIDATVERIDELDSALADIAAIFGIDSTAWDFQSELLRLMNYEFSSPAWRDAARVGLALLEERNGLLVEQADLERELEFQQARLARLEEQRAQIGFLQQQLDLLNLIRENELDTSILEGLTLGLDADPGALMDAMTAAIRQMIQAAEDELGIASASKVMRRIAAQAKEGLIVEMAEHRGVVNAARGMVSSLVDAAEFALSGLGGGAVDSSRRMTLYGGQHFYFQQRRGSVLDEMQGLLAP